MEMMRTLRYRSIMLGLMAMMLVPAISSAQFLGTNPPGTFRDLGSLKPPSGSKAAIVVFEDLGCPACAYAHSIELEAARRADVPLIRHDFPIPAHVWTFQGAVCARYIQSRISPQLAEQYRSDVFHAQSSIASKDDIEHFTQLWLQRHGQRMPFVMDPDGSLAKAVQADYDLGLHINLTHTPTTLVVTQNRQQVVCGTETTVDPSRIYPVVEAALASAQTPHAHPARSAH